MTLRLKILRAGSCFAACALLASASCSDAETRGESVEPETVAVEARVIEQTSSWVEGSYDAFVSASSALQESTSMYAASLDPGDRAAAQQAWRAAIGSWQRLEMILIGPAAAMGASVGGADFRDTIYSWPVVNPCRVDQETVSLGFEGGLDASPVNVRGLDALEYLLFVGDAENACQPNSGINQDGDWAELEIEEIAQRRADYASAAAADLESSALALRAAWGSFALELETAGETSSLFPRQREALNGISDALFYLDTDVKDMKLAEPSGLSDCIETVCPQALESQYAGVSREHVRQNVQAFLELFGEDETTGFYGLLAHHGAGPVGADIVAAAEAALVVIDDLEGGFDSILATEPEQLVEVYDAIKAVTDLLKTQFLSILDLDLPDRAAGDND